MTTDGCWIPPDIPVGLEQLVALPEPVVEEHVDAFESQLCVVDGLGRRILQAPRLHGGRHRDTLHRGRGREGGAAGSADSPLKRKNPAAGGADCLEQTRSCSQLYAGLRANCLGNGCETIACITKAAVPHSAARRPVFMFLLLTVQTPETRSVSGYRDFQFLLALYAF